MALDNSQKMDIIKDAILNGYKGSFEELYMQADPESVEVAETPEQQEQGLRGREAEEMPDAMVFPEASGDFNTMGMKAPINIDKVNENGDLVQSYRNVPPGVGNLPMGDDVGTVIETPAKYDDGGFYKVSDIIEYQKGGYRDSVEVFSKQYKKDLNDYYKENVKAPPKNKRGTDMLTGDYKAGYYDWATEDSGTLRSMDRILGSQNRRKAFGKQTENEKKVINAIDNLSDEDREELTSFANKTAKKFIDKNAFQSAKILAKLDLDTVKRIRKKVGLSKEDLLNLMTPSENATWGQKAKASIIKKAVSLKDFKKGGYKKKYC